MPECTCAGDRGRCFSPQMTKNKVDSALAARQAPTLSRGSILFPCDPGLAAKMCSPHRATHQFLWLKSPKEPFSPSHKHIGLARRWPPGYPPTTPMLQCSEQESVFRPPSTPAKHRCLLIRTSIGRDGTRQGFFFSFARSRFAVDGVRGQMMQQLFCSTCIFG